MAVTRPLFRDRRAAGRLLAAKLARYAERPDVVVLALPRGGVPVAYEVARALGAPLDVFVVRKLGLPGHEEVAMGAVATGGVRVLNEQITRALAIPEHVIDAITALGATRESSFRRIQASVAKTRWRWVSMNDHSPSTRSWSSSSGNRRARATVSAHSSSSVGQARR